jgi:hypothetical protein
MMMMMMMMMMMISEELIGNDVEGNVHDEI